MRCGSRRATKTRCRASWVCSRSTIGLPYFLLSTTGPLVQAWFARSFPSGTVYRLVRAVEFRVAAGADRVSLRGRAVDRRRACSRSCWSVRLRVVRRCSAQAPAFTACAPRTAAASATERTPERRRRPRRPRRATTCVWLLLVGDGLVHAARRDQSHYAERRVGAVPVDTAADRCICITFILCFEGRGWYQRTLFSRAAARDRGARMAWGLHADGGIMDVNDAVPLYSAGLFVLCMFFHGELAAMKPAPRYLTTLLSDGIAGRRAGRLVRSVSSRR